MKTRIFVLFYPKQGKSKRIESNEYSNLLITVRESNQKKAGEYFFHQKFLYISKLNMF